MKLDSLMNWNRSRLKETIKSLNIKEHLIRKETTTNRRSETSKVKALVLRPSRLKCSSPSKKRDLSGKAKRLT